MNILLSICIPTYNRAKYLKEALESILPQTSDEIEIVVSDNASPDDTREVVARLQKVTSIRIVYERSAVNQGNDWNFLRVVELASGRYCWLFGDDDRMAPGAIYDVLEQIRQNPEVDVFLGDRENFDLNFKKKFNWRPILKQAKEQVFDFNKIPVSAYLKEVNKLPGIFSFISGMIFKKDKWAAVEGRDEYLGSRYIHIYMFMSILWGKHPGVLKYLPDRIVLARWGNDQSFKPGALLERIKYDVEIFHNTAFKILKDPKTVKQIDAILIKNDLFSWSVRARATAGWKFYSEIIPFLFHYYRGVPLFWLKIVPLMFVPRSLLIFARWGYRVAIKGERLGLNEVYDI